jgi:hypothetical protein
MAMSLQDEREPHAHLFGRFADGNCTRDVCGSVQVLAAAIDEEQLSSPELAVRRLVDPVMHDGAVGAAAGNGVEANLAQLVRRATFRFQLAHGLDLVDLA